MTEIKAKKKSRKKLYIFGGIGVLLLALVILVILKGNKEEIIIVQTENVIKRDITQTVSAIGSIDPVFKVVITPEVTGEIVSLPVKEGDVVKKGTVLLRIKADTYLAAKERAEANLQSAKATLSARKAELDKITADYNRAKELYAKKLSSDAELEAIKSQYLSLSSLYNGAEANVLQSEAAVREAVEQLNKTTIVSPMDGTVTQLNVELGERVLGSGFSQGTNIMTVADLSNMQAIVDVDENDITLISYGDTARVKVDAFGDHEFLGVVYEIGNSAKQSGFGTQDQVINFEVKIKIFAQDKKIRPGMSCNANIETETRFQVISVPIPSVTARVEQIPKSDEEEPSQLQVSTKKNGNGEMPQEIVFLVSEGKAKSVKVKTGISDDNYIEITEGLAGDEEVVSGSYRAISRELENGKLVKVENRDGGKKKPDNK
ncbi:MAG: efflux RND transporter periplasmic adaptor subunit [Ignavibacteriales bacterium]|nr:MAG: efflux RND transporter periplasmic adaptor subunit [Ignavibacteriales bacterium]